VRPIVKGPEPHSLIEHRKSEHSDFDNYQGKDDLRRALAGEQRGLCCYCMGRIREDPRTMKVEHWRSQDNYPHEQLNYRNLLGACIGGEGQPANHQHCDTRKRNLDLMWNPANPEHHVETRLKYEPDGTIRADEPVFDTQLNQVLNLNLAWLKNNRKSVLTALLQWWNGSKPISSERIDREIRSRTGGNGELQPYCQVAVWWLTRKLAR
jgi:uncharacterized protein (TIGR02646 family)